MCSNCSGRVKRAGTISRNGAERNWGLKYGTERIRNDRIGLGGLAMHGDSSNTVT